MVLLRTALFVLFTVLTIGLTKGSTAPCDTIIPSSITYAGYRVYIRKVKVLKQKGKEFVLGMEVVNTGKRPISFGPGFPARYLQTRFDESLGRSGLLPLGLQIREGLLSTRESLEVGEWRKDIELTVHADQEIKYAELTRDDYERVSSTIQRRPTRNGSDGATVKNEAFAKTSRDCVDLTLSSVKILQKTKKTATVQVTISNSGSSNFRLDDIHEGLSLSMYVSGSPRLSSSSKRLARIGLAKKLSSQGKASLARGENVVLVERVDISQATRYTAVFIAQLDSGQVIEECSETNNEAHVLLFD